MWYRLQRLFWRIWFRLFYRWLDAQDDEDYPAPPQSKAEIEANATRCDYRPTTDEDWEADRRDFEDHANQHRDLLGY
jgi:hypothetical protein